MSSHSRRAVGPLTLPMLGRVFDELSLGLHTRCGARELRITAASAVTILDHCTRGLPLAMRDFDVVLFAERRVTQAWAEGLGEALSSPSLEYVPRLSWPRDRAHPDHPGRDWRAGWGLIFDAAGLEVDLSLFHDAEAHELNGLLDIHRVRLPLACAPGAFSRSCIALHGTAPEAAVASGLVEDPHGGYASWRARTARVVAWEAVALRPIQCAIRVVRDFVQKLGRDALPIELAAGLRRHLAAGSPLDTRALDARNLLKVLGDLDAARELALLGQLGAFAAWLPSLDESLRRLGVAGIEATFDAPAASTQPRVEARLLALLNLPGLRPRDRDALLEAVATLEQALVDRIRSALGPTDRPRRAPTSP